MDAGYSTFLKITYLNYLYMLTPYVAENHWAYEYVGKLAAAGIIEGYPDGKFSGDRMMSRYEFAAMLYRAM